MEISTALSSLLQKILLVPIVGLWAFHLYQRRFKESAVRRRIGTLSLTAVLIAAWVAAWVFERYTIDDRWLSLVAAAAAVLVIWQRRLMLPFRVRCVRCGKPLGLTRMLSWDSNLCEACEPPAKEGEVSR